jgi:hypothetical protein
MKLNNIIYHVFVFSMVSLSCFIIPTVHGHEGGGNEELCEHGKLYVSDYEDGSKVHIIDVHDIGNMTEEGSVAIKGVAGSNVLYASANRQIVASLNYGTEDMNYTNGNVEWIHTGVGKDDDGNITFSTPQVFSSIAFDCVLPLHFVTQNNKIGIFCDGTYEPQMNSTVWLIDETKLTLETLGRSAIIYNTTLEGSHHGDMVPMEDEDILYSLPTTNRILRGENASLDEFGEHRTRLESGGRCNFVFE